jgi:hypothetical protein
MDIITMKRNRKILVINTLTIKLEINNHFNNGCNAQVFNGKVSGKFIKQQKKVWKKKEMQ